MKIKIFVLTALFIFLFPTPGVRAQEESGVLVSDIRGTFEKYLPDTVKRWATYAIGKAEEFRARMIVVLEEKKEEAASELDNGGQGRTPSDLLKYGKFYAYSLLLFAVGNKTVFYVLLFLIAFSILRLFLNWFLD